ncbi:putative Dipeptidyl-peptidase [Blattamonas nauphoetae]|uniref:Dipeptidyl-peptidase n=1 Tax=Blattamonas nauphoetae TaxID=2049346 RepID=A0ABQ9XN04_9EUKA|nr:putative Dipeptidyl-peptidase [Blattamonas nauphoetae]
MMLISIVVTSLLSADVLLTAEMNTQLYKIRNTKTSPDGTMYAFITRKWSLDTNTAENVFHVREVSTGNELGSFKDDTNGFTDYAWAPDSKAVIFTSPSSKQQEIKLLTIPEFVSTSLLQVQVPISNLKWSQNGQAIAFTAYVYPGMTIEETADYDKLRQNYKSDALAYDRLPVYSWDRYNDGKYSHVFSSRVEIKDVEGKRSYTLAQPIDHMFTVSGHCPFHPQGGSSDFDLSPDGKFVAYIIQYGTSMAHSVRNHVYITPTTVNEEFRGRVDLNDGETGKKYNPKFSPDGRYLAYLSTLSDIDESEEGKIVVIDILTKLKKPVQHQFEYQIGELVWASDKQSIFSTTTIKAVQYVYKFPLDSAEAPSQVFSRGVSSFSFVDDKSAIVTASSFTSPPALFLSTLDSAVYEPRFPDNDATLATLTTPLKAPELITFKGALDEDVDMWYFEPLVTTGAPLVMWIHGGPESCFSDSWSDRWNPQVFAQQGFALALPQFHGSTSYGKKFREAIVKNWATHPVTDVLAARKAILAKYNYLSEKKTAAMGGSFGGYTVNILAGQDTQERNPFVALVCHDGTYDQAMHYMESDQLYFGEREFGARSWDDRTLFDKYSPSHQPGAGKWHVPQLIFQGDKDYRVARGQGIGMFTVLQRVGCPSRLVYFPSENHWVVKPGNSIEWHKQAIEWLKKYTANEEVEKTLAKKRELLA